VFTIGNRHIELRTHIRSHNAGSFHHWFNRTLFNQPATEQIRKKRRETEEDSATMKKFIHLKRIMIESGEDYGLGFPASPKTPNTVSKNIQSNNE
jgi:hypothetical protein